MKNLFTNILPVVSLRRVSEMFCLILLIILLNAGDSMSQLQDKTISNPDKEFFYIDPIVFYSKDQMKARLDVYIEVPMDNLQFKKNYTTKNYDASINYTIKITNSSNEIVSNESISDYVSTTKNDQKKLDESAKFIVKEFYLNPGTYSLEVTLNDINT
nr:hypothetical protein [Bacteroidota bacterium]